MDNKDFTKINLRDFRYNLSQLKDALAKGEVFQVIERGNPIAYFISAKYEIELKNKKISQEVYKKLLNEIKGRFELKDEIKGFKNPMEGYRFLLRKKYLKK